jgi:hypothetical protein
MAYVLAYREIRLRDIVLTQTGHFYLGSAGKLSFVLLLISLGWFAIAACTSSRSALSRSFGGTALRLILTQVVGYTVLEIVERAAVGAPVAEMFGHYTFALGLLMQTITALAGAGLVLVLTRTARRAYLLVTARNPRATAREAAPRPLFEERWVLRRGLVGAFGVRGPPRFSPS